MKVDIRGIRARLRTDKDRFFDLFWIGDTNMADFNLILEGFSDVWDEISVVFRRDKDNV